MPYAFICAIISITLFMSWGRFEAQAAPLRGIALAATIVAARKSKSAVSGMLIGTLLVLVLSWIG